LFGCLGDTIGRTDRKRVINTKEKERAKHGKESERWFYKGKDKKKWHICRDGEGQVPSLDERNPGREGLGKSLMSRGGKLISCTIVPLLLNWEKKREM